MKNKAMNYVKMSDILPHVPAVKIVVDDDFVSLYPKHGYPDGYNIQRSRLRTPQKILGWINHLSGKNWMDAEAIATFAIEAFELLDIEPDRRL